MIRHLESEQMKLNEWDLTDLQSICTAQETISERQPRLEKFYQMKIPTGNLPPYIQTAHKAQYKKPSNPIKISKHLNAHFSREGVEMAIKYKKRLSASLVLRERQISGPMR